MIAFVSQTDTVNKRKILLSGIKRMEMEIIKLLFFIFRRIPANSIYLFFFKWGNAAILA